MSNRVNTASEKWYAKAMQTQIRLRAWSVDTWSLEGKDAADFLQRLSTIDVAKLAVDGVARGLCLGGGAELLATFYCHRLSAGRFLLIAPSSEGGALAAHLDRMTFAEDLRLESLVASGFEAFGKLNLFAASGELVSPHPQCRTQLSAAAGDYEGRNYLAWQESPELSRGYFLGEQPAFLAAASGTDWDLALLRARIPQIGAEWEPGQRALDAGFLYWIDRFKGCYPGQEVIEKSLNLGHPVQALVEFTGPPGVESKADLWLGEKRVGVVTTAVPTDDESVQGLARVLWAARKRGTSLSLAAGTEPLIEITHTVEEMEQADGKSSG